MGEGWHNNHHAYQSSVRQGFRWWEIDPTFYLLKALSFIGVVWDLKTPPAEVRRNQHRLGSRVIERAAAQLAGSFNTDMPSSAPSPRRLSGPSSRPPFRRRSPARKIAPPTYSRACTLPELPTRHEIVARGAAMFADTPSMEVDRQPRPGGDPRSHRHAA